MVSIVASDFRGLHKFQSCRGLADDNLKRRRGWMFTDPNFLTFNDQDGRKECFNSVVRACLGHAAALTEVDVSKLVFCLQSGLHLSSPALFLYPGPVAQYHKNGGRMCSVSVTNVMLLLVLGHFACYDFDAQ